MHQHYLDVGIGQNLFIPFLVRDVFDKVTDA